MPGTGTVIADATDDGKARIRPGVGVRERAVPPRILYTKPKWLKAKCLLMQCDLCGWKNSRPHVPTMQGLEWLCKQRTLVPPCVGLNDLQSRSSGVAKHPLAKRTEGLYVLLKPRDCLKEAAGSRWKVFDLQLRSDFSRVSESVSLVPPG